jgi:hypothetical protein
VKKNKKKRRKKVCLISILLLLELKLIKLCNNYLKREKKTIATR